ncbi:DNA alkylation repair protein [Sanguibacter sp. HDW7]|uniref:DNA alkylation repair protein n=1 Tax=Sanguibacter sp. HDW7 TaxID=2714931 RepID=UPI001407EF4A|nr:DNA alkylation repair protein [Sanguibacter sp. HDW7]QIK84695.1 DNA alkylation repair protein [Sanguibacter sp. HDW7]
MPETMTRDDALAELAALHDPKVRAVNERHGDDHSVNLTKLRGVAKRLGTTQTPLARELWATGDGDARLLALLILKSKDLTADELDTMLREARTPKQQDWLVGYVVRKSPHVEALRVRWKGDSDPWVESAGWALTSDLVPKKADDLDLPGLLDEITVRMKDAPERLQWAMNWCLGTIGIHHPVLRERVLAIGERLEVLKDYPTPPGCVSPYVPLWVSEMVSRQG